MKRILAAVLSLLMLCGCGNLIVKNEDISSREADETKIESPESVSKEKDDSTEDSGFENETGSDSERNTEDDKEKNSEEKNSDSDKYISKSGSDSDVDTEKSKTDSKTNSKTNSAADTASNITSNDENADSRQIVQTSNDNDAGMENNDVVSENTSPESEENSEPENVYDPYGKFDVSRAVDDSWFDDCVFVGDSLTVGLEMFNDSANVFGDAKFICSVGLNYGNAQWDLYDPNNVHPIYDGSVVLAEDAGVVTGAKKAIVAMGINDIAVWNPQRGVENARGFIEKMKAKSPDMKIYLQTVNPMVSYAQKSNLSNDLINEFNAGLRDLAEEEGCGFINSHDIFVADDGSLPEEMCSDPGNLGIHLTSEACRIWADYIKCSVE